jgi:hypothetical protein
MPSPSAARKPGAPRSPAASIGAPCPPVEVDDGVFYGDEAWQKKARAGLSRQEARTEPSWRMADAGQGTGTRTQQEAKYTDRAYDPAAKTLTMLVNGKPTLPRKLAGWVDLDKVPAADAEPAQRDGRVTPCVNDHQDPQQCLDRPVPSCATTASSPRAPRGARS